MKGRLAILLIVLVLSLAGTQAFAAKTDDFVLNSISQIKNAVCALQQPQSDIFASIRTILGQLLPKVFADYDGGTNPEAPPAVSTMSSPIEVIGF